MGAAPARARAMSLPVNHSPAPPMSFAQVALPLPVRQTFTYRVPS